MAARSGILGLGSRLYPGNMQRIFIKDLTRFMQSLSRERQNRASKRKALLAGWLHSSSHPQHVKHEIPFSQFLRLRRLCSDESDFNSKCEETCSFSKNVATLTPLSPQANIVPKKSIEKLQHKRYRKKKPTEFHPLLPSTKPCSQKCHSQKLQNSPQ